MIEKKAYYHNEVWRAKSLKEILNGTFSFKWKVIIKIIFIYGYTNMTFLHWIASKCCIFSIDEKLTPILTLQLCQSISLIFKGKFSKAVNWKY